jgi:hypothetical protein
LEQVKEFFGGAGSISKSGNMYFYSSRTTSQTINILVWGRLFTFTLATLGKPKAEGPQPPWQANNKFLPLVRHYSSKSTPVLYSDKKKDG